MSGRETCARCGHQDNSHRRDGGCLGHLRKGGDCTCPGFVERRHERACACGVCYEHAIANLARATDATAEVRQCAIRLIARKWRKHEREVVWALTQERERR